MGNFESEPCPAATAKSAGASLRELTRTEFDELLDAEQFAEGPFIETFGDGYGEPYRPNRQAFGRLKSGEWVWAWVRGRLVRLL